MRAFTIRNEASPKSPDYLGLAPFLPLLSGSIARIIEPCKSTGLYDFGQSILRNSIVRFQLSAALLKQRRARLGDTSRLLVSVGNPAARQIVGRHLYADAISH